MAKKHLVIVESPAKGKTIERYLGKDYQVLASYGHVRDLPKSKMGVEIDDGSFAPHYLVPAKAKKAVASLKKAAASANDIYLATDYDREGEAIAWHVLEALKLNKSTPVHRITFHEITKSALEKAVKNPRELDYDLIDAQQARRILDRLVGYTLSPFLWKKVMKGLSAGRVQSVAVRLIVDREKEIKAFKPQEYWSIDGQFLRGSDQFTASLIEFGGDKLDKMSIKSEVESKKIEQALGGLDYQISSIEKKERKKRPSPPFTTSTLQQQAAHRLHFSAKQTMKLAQDLYEDGHITYMRTDSVNLAEEAIKATRKLVENEYGGKYLPKDAQHYKTRSKGAQEAHEAIRPTHVDSLPGNLNLKSEKHDKLYKLIWQRMVASQMSPALLKAETVLVKSTDGQGIFKATGNVVDFEGYLKVWPTAREDKILPKLKEQESVDLDKMNVDQHFTEPPPRYSEASLIKALEEHGIGRPSTYAPTLSTIQDRGYVELLERRFHPTETGENVNAILVKHFPDIVDLDFTAEMEEDLDKVAEGKKDWTKLLGDFYKPFHKLVEEKTEDVPKLDLTEKTDKICPECGKSMVIRPGRYGKFLACTGFPDCKHTEPIIKKTGVTCPECKEGELIERKTRRGKTFWGCQRYPKCKYATWDDPNKKKNQEGE